MRLTERSIPLTAFSTTLGQFAFCKMPFGAANAPSCYARLVDVEGALREVPPDTFLHYIDDVLCYSTDF